MYVQKVIIYTLLLKVNALIFKITSFKLLFQTEMHKFNINLKKRILLWN